MSDINQPIIKTPEEELSTFYFLIYTANPTRDTVKVWVDGNRVKLLMKRDKFYSIIEKLLGYQLSTIVHETCLTYGCFYQLDRNTCEVQKLHPAAVKKHLNPAEDFKKVNEVLHKNENSLESQYQNSLEEWANQGIKQAPYIRNKQEDTDVGENRLK